MMQQASEDYEPFLLTGSKRLAQMLAVAAVFGLEGLVGGVVVAVAVGGTPIEVFAAGGVALATGAVLVYPMWMGYGRLLEWVGALPEDGETA